MNDFAEIVIIYQSLVGVDSFNCSMQPLGIYINRTFALFSKDIPKKTKTKVTKDVVKYLDRALYVTGWDTGK